MYEPDFTEVKLGKRSLLDAEEISFEDKNFLEKVGIFRIMVSTTLQSQKKIRVVFDCSAKYGQTSLNQ